MELPGAVDPWDIYLTARILSSYATIKALAALDDEALEATLRDDMAQSLAQARVGTGTSEHAVHLVTSALTWIFSPDATVGVGVRRVRESD